MYWISGIDPRINVIYRIKEDNFLVSLRKSDGSLIVSRRVKNYLPSRVKTL
jgi:hypothetical protein